MTQMPAQYSPLTVPPTDPGVGFGEAISRVFKKYVEFGGVAGRSEYWWFTLFVVLVSSAASVLDLVIGTGGTLNVLVGLGLVLPHLAVGVRRLRDAGYHWAFLFVALVPFAGPIVLIVLLAGPSKRQPV